MAYTPLADGLYAFVKRACPTCTMIEGVLRDAASVVPAFHVVSQDDPRFPSGLTTVIDDRELDHSWHHEVEATPTLVVRRDGRVAETVTGWDRAAWQRLTGIATLGAKLPPLQPG